MQASVLLFGLDTMENAMVSSVLTRCGLSAVTPPRTQYAQPLGQLAGQTLPVFGNAAQGVLVAPVLVFCYTAQDQMDNALTALRSAGLGRGALKAVLTPTNSLWNVYMLSAELAQEHAKMAQQVQKLQKAKKHSKK